MYDHILSCNSYTAFTTSYRLWIFVTLLAARISLATSARLSLLFLINHRLFYENLIQQINRKKNNIIPTYKAKLIITSSQHSNTLWAKQLCSRHFAQRACLLEMDIYNTGFSMDMPTYNLSQTYFLPPVISEKNRNEANITVTQECNNR